MSDKITLFFPNRFLRSLASPTPSWPRPPVISTRGWSDSEKETEWKLASEATWRGETPMHRTGTMEIPHPQPELCSSWLTALLTFLTIGIFLLQLGCPSAGNRAEANWKWQFIGHCLFGRPIKMWQKVGVVPHLKKKKKKCVRESSSSQGYHFVHICFILKCL